MPLAVKDYREILKDELEVRLQQNARYSLRAFARDLSCSPSRISEVINYKRGLSLAAAQRIAEHLGYGPDDTTLFLTLVESVHSRSPARREAAKKRIQALKRGALPEASSEFTQVKVAWYHSALLELTRLSGFSGKTSWLARRLGISSFQVENSFRRLKRLGFATFVEGKFTPRKQAQASSRGLPKKMFNLELEGIARRASEARHTQSPQAGHHSAVVFALSKRQVLEFKKRIQELEHEFARISARSRKPTRIYCLALNFFSLDQA